MSRLSFVACLLLVVSPAAVAQENVDTPRTLITNVNVFDGVNEALIENANVVVEGNLIKQVSTNVIEAGDATVIDGGGPYRPDRRSF
jgi:hypothetical protein